MTPWLYFASGSNHAGEIQGFGAVGQHVGVAAPEVNEAAVEALLALPPTVHVFVDSVRSAWGRSPALQPQSTQNENWPTPCAALASESSAGTDP